MGLSEKLRAKIAAKKQSIKEKSGLRADVMRPPQGKHKFRILPAKPEKGPDAQFWGELGLHYIRSDEKSDSGHYKTKAVYVCVEETFGKPCAVCEAIEAAARHAVDDEQLELIEESRCKRAEILLNVLHLNGDKPTTPQILQITPKTFLAICELMDEYENITDLKEGTDIIINREGSGKNGTTYTVLPAAKSKPVNPAVLEQMEDLDEYVNQEHEDGLRKALSAVNATVGLLESPVIPSKALESKVEAAPKPLSKTDELSDDDLMTIMDAELAEEPEAKEEPVDMEVKRTGTDDAPVSTGSTAASDADADIDDIDDLLKDLEDL